MNTSGEAAEQVVKIMLEGSEVLLRLTGSGAKNVAVMLTSIFKQQKKTRGSIRMTNMLRSGKPLKVVTLRSKDLPKFRQTAGKYGIMYTVLKTRNDKDGIFDVMIRADDESKMTRLIERYKMTAVDTAAIRSEIIKEKDAPAAASANQETEKEEPVLKEEKEDPSENQEQHYEPDVGDLNERPANSHTTLSKADLQQMKEKDGTENGNPTTAKADQDLSSEKAERVAGDTPSKDSKPKELTTEEQSEKTKNDPLPDESPFWPSSRKKKEKENQISVLRAIERKRAERAAMQKSKELLNEQPKTKTNINNKEGR